MIAVVFSFPHMDAHTQHKEAGSQREVMLRSQASARGYGKGMGH